MTENIENNGGKTGDGDESNTKPFVLTDRDIDVMRFAHEQRYLCFNQISDGFWKERSEDANACKHRVQKMVSGGYLAKHYCGRMKADLYLATDKAVAELKARGLDSGIPAMKFSRGFERYVSHDLHVTNLRILFRELGWQNWTSERVLRERDHFYHRPDGVLTVRGYKVAIEFENWITKGKVRYKEMLDFYSGHEGFMLLFVIIRKDARDWLIDFEYDASKVWFANYEELMEIKEKAVFENKRDSFELSRML